MNKKVFEENDGPHLGHAAGDSDVEKQASQLASDVKYKVKKTMGAASNLGPAQVTRAYIAQLSKSPAPPTVKALAKKKLIGEEYIEDLPQIVEKTISNVLYKVFVEGVKPEEQIVEIEEEIGGRKYQVRVKDKATGNTYVTKATREKIRELRANPNISSVEMTSYGEPTDSESKKGTQTASVKAGKGLDPVGQEDKDIDNDGDHDKTDKYLLNRRRVRGTAIAKKTGKVQEEFLGEVKKKTDEDKVKEDGVNNYRDGAVKLFPELSEQSPMTVSNTDVENAKTAKPPSDQNQKRQAQVNDRIRQKEIEITQKKLSALRSAPRGSDPSIMASYEPEGDQIDEKITAKTDMGTAIEDFYASKSPQLAGRTREQRRDAAIAAVLTARRGGKKLGEECDCEDEKEPKLKTSQDGAEDPRSIPTKVNLIKNKLRAMGLKMSYEPKGEMVDEGRGEFRSLGRADRNDGRNRYMGSATPQQEREEGAAAEASAKKAKEQLARNLAREARNKGR